MGNKPNAEFRIIKVRNSSTIDNCMPQYRKRMNFNAADYTLSDTRYNLLDKCCSYNEAENIIKTKIGDYDILAEREQKDFYLLKM